MGLLSDGTRLLLLASATLAVVTTFLQLALRHSGIESLATEYHHGRILLEENDADEGETLRIPRVLVGIFTQDDATGYEQRQAYRRMIRNMNDKRVCALDEYLKSSSPSSTSESCSLVHTFVVGQMTGTTTEIVDETVTPLTLRQQVETSSQGTDLNQPDVTRLNIR